MTAGGKHIPALRAMVTKFCVDMQICTVCHARRPENSKRTQCNLCNERKKAAKKKQGGSSYDKAYYQRNKEKIIQRKREYREENKESILKYGREYYYKNKKELNRKRRPKS